MNARLCHDLRHGLNSLRRIPSAKTGFPSRNLHWTKTSISPCEGPKTHLPCLQPLLKSFWEIMTEQADKVLSQHNRTEMLDLQKYLGLQPPMEGTGKKVVDANERDLVFLSIDLEAFEFAQNKITEIGVSVLDTRDIVDIEPGINSAAWLSCIKTRHLRISENKKLVNRRFIKGCADKFNFGKSEFVSMRQVNTVLADIFANPAGVRPKPIDKRKIVLVGHGLGNDTAYLKTLNFSPHASGNIFRNMDTQTLAGATKKSQIGLERVLRGLGADPKNLHNAGNDAAYTLQALVMMAVQHTEKPGAYFQAIQSVYVPETFKQKLKRESKARRKARDAAESAKKAEAAGQAEGDMPATELVESAAPTCHINNRTVVFAHQNSQQTTTTTTTTTTAVQTPG